MIELKYHKLVSIQGSGSTVSIPLTLHLRALKNTHIREQTFLIFLDNYLREKVSNTYVESESFENTRR